MAQAGYTPILIYASSTPGALPSAANLSSSASGAELAINYADGKLYFKNSSGVVTLLAGSSSGPAGGSNTQVQYNSSGVLAGSSNMTFDGTSLTLGGNPTLSAGTANGVLYLNGSKVATSGSALVFNEATTRLGVGVASPAYTIDSGGIINTASAIYWGAGVGKLQFSGSDAFIDSNGSTIFRISGSTEQMRLTSTGLGIGTSSPASKLDVKGRVTLSGVGTSEVYTSDASGMYLTAATSGGMYVASDNYFIFRKASSPYTEWMRLDSSGNLGLGVTPSAWSTGKAIEVANLGNAIWSPTGNINDIRLTANLYYNGAYKYAANGRGNMFTVGSTTGQFEWYTAGNNTSGAGATATLTQAMTLDSSGRLGIGVTSPATKLQVNVASDTSIHCYSPSAAVAQIAALNDAGNSSKQLNLDGSPLVFGVEGVERARINSSGNLGLGGSAARATTAGSAIFNIFNGTAPVGTLTNGISLYSSSGEAYVMDAAGNATLFSPHDRDTNEWIFRSKHTPSGKVLKIDVERLLRFVNDHFGLDAVQEFIEP